MKFTVRLPRRGLWRAWIAFAAIGLVSQACAPQPITPAAPVGIHKLQHVIFISQQEIGRATSCEAFPSSPICTAPSGRPDVMGWHDAREIPNYWTWAENYVLQDHMYEPVKSYSEPSHLYMVSGWSAFCSDPYTA